MVENTPKFKSLMSILKERASEAAKTGIQIDTSEAQEAIKSVINGDDSLNDFLVITANLGKEKQGLLIYLVTNRKFIEVEVDPSGSRSLYAFLNQAAGVSRNNSRDEEGNNYTEIMIEFPQNSFGLRYSSDNKEINEFFQRVDEVLRGATV